MLTIPTYQVCGRKRRRHQYNWLSLQRIAPYNLGGEEVGRLLNGAFLQVCFFQFYLDKQVGKYGVREVLLLQDFSMLTVNVLFFLEWTMEFLPQNIL
jgi:hypothetical protein